MRNRSQLQIFLGSNLDRWMHLFFKLFRKYEKAALVEHVRRVKWFDAIDLLSDQPRPSIMTPF